MSIRASNKRWIAALSAALMVCVCASASAQNYSLGDEADEVATIQTALKQLKLYSAGITGHYGEKTEAAVKKFQKKYAFEDNGIVDEDTRAALYEAAGITYTASGSSSSSSSSAASSSSSSSVSGSAILRYGTRSDEVLKLQQNLTKLGLYTGTISGHYGSITEAAVMNFQRKNGLSADGIAGAKTLAKIEEKVNGSSSSSSSGSSSSSSSSSSNAAANSSNGLLKYGVRSDAVRTLQQNLKTLGYYDGSVTGNFGRLTKEAVYNFQKRNGLTRDGVAGNKTLIALYSASAATPTPAPTIAPVNTPSAASVIASASALHRGDNGTAVKAMQQRLIDLGYLTSGSADGIFGVKTYQALRDFQLANALYVDGVAGKNTIASLNSSSATGKNTARPNTTATPTPNISNDIGTTTKVSAENVVYEYWYSTVRSACRQYPYATVYDYSTGISWQVHMFSYGKHAEAEPLTAADTAKLEQAFGGNTWTPKAVWVIFADGTVRMATTHSMPHEVQHITDNNFPGHLCIHFPRTQAQVTAIGPYAMSHQQTVEKGWAETQAMIAN